MKSRFIGLIILLALFVTTVGGAIAGSNLQATVDQAAHIVSISGPAAEVRVNGNLVWSASAAPARITCDLAGKVWALSWDSANRWLYMESHFQALGQRMLGQDFAITCVFQGDGTPGDLTTPYEALTVSRVWTYTFRKGQEFRIGWSAW